MSMETNLSKIGDGVEVGKKLRQLKKRCGRDTFQYIYIVFWEFVRDLSK